MPPSLREWLPSEHLVWFVLEVVEQLDTGGFHARHPQAGPGRRAFDPDLLLAVLIYAYATGERSSRRIEAACRDHVAFQVLCGRDVPDHTVISRFRAAHEDWFAEVFAQVLVLCAQAGMGRLGTVAIDGTKIAANASIFANRAEESLRAEARRIAAQIAAEAAAVDAEEDERYGATRGDELAPEFADPATRAAAIKAALAQLEAQKKKQADQDDHDAQESQRRAESWQDRLSAAQAALAAAQAAQAAKIAAWECGHRQAEAQGTPRPPGRRPVAENATVRRARAKVARLQVRVETPSRGRKRPAAPRKANLTDPESRIMNTRTGWVQGYNAQLAVTADHLILALMLTQDPNDMACLVPMMTAAEHAAHTVTTHQRPTQAPHPASQAADAASQAASEQGEEGIGLVLADAGYYSQANLSAPGPDRLIATGKDRQMRAVAAEDPRIGAPPVEASPTEQMQHRLRTPEGIAAYAARGATVEPVNGHLKDQVGLRRFSRRGLAAATSELNLAAAVVNLLKLHRHTTALAPT